MGTHQWHGIIRGCHVVVSIVGPKFNKFLYGSVKKTKKEKIKVRERGKREREGGGEQRRGRVSG
jgi:hypothetical protein